MTTSALDVLRPDADGRLLSKTMSAPRDASGKLLVNRRRTASGYVPQLTGDDG